MISRRRLAAGESVGYGASWTAQAATDIAAAANTIAYELFCRLTPRVAFEVI